MSVAKEIEMLGELCKSMDERIRSLWYWTPPEEPPTIPLRLRLAEEMDLLRGELSVAKRLIERHRKGLAQARLENTGEPFAEYGGIRGSSLCAAVVIAAECVCRQYRDQKQINQQKGV